MGRTLSVITKHTYKQQQGTVSLSYGSKVGYNRGIQGGDTAKHIIVQC